MKKALSIVLLSTAILVTATSVHAAEPKKIDSDATIQMKAGTKPVDPVDPVDPTKPGPDTGTGQGGEMQINYVTNLDFGSDVAITSGTTKANVGTKFVPYFQISDLRGTGAGWALKATLGDFVSKTDSSRKIAGATLTFDNPKIMTNNSDKTEAAEGTGKQVLTAGGGSSVMMKAAKGNGRGTWLVTYPAKDLKDNSNIKFEAPSKNIDSNTQYGAKITWELYDGPMV
ncbi:WxL domain-containing protein [Vagococcus silagei]|uniref:WxL domain-containing protein n=1 Tax=Vagococcus silagei TaxID=2508885 RepID=A0A4S3B686_9ENTE|nr:WxL domain-containing protein [Vagococcus silagei]THB60105.1 WxL domain-containing protein [Vagococcus silagei]